MKAGESIRVDRMNLKVRETGDADDRTAVFSLGHAGYVGIYLNELKYGKKRERSFRIMLSPEQKAELLDLLQTEVEAR